MIEPEYELRRAEALAEVWAVIDGKGPEFRACREIRELEDKLGHYGGYVAEARSMIRRLEARGYSVVALPAEPKA
jgi:hypothetical protein